MADEEAIAASLVGLATVSYSRGEYTPALGYYREALVIYEKRDEGASIGRTLVSIGNVQFLQAEYDEAGADGEFFSGDGHRPSTPRMGGFPARRRGRYGAFGSSMVISALWPRSPGWPPKYM